jgi:ATP-dependent Clp protease ATP-binding subunit ClpC
MSALAPPFSACPVCQGQSQAAVTCASCRGAGITVASPDGPLMWQTALSDQFFRLRVTEKKIQSAAHISLGIAIVVALGWGGWSFTKAGMALFSGLQPGFGLAILLGCFLLFRVRRDRGSVRAMPNWLLSGPALAAHEARAATKTYAQDIGPYLQTSVWQLLEKAYSFTAHVGRLEIRPLELFMVALTDSEGGIFLTRLGAEYDQISPALNELLRSESTGSPTILSTEAKQVLLSSYLDARAVGRHSIGVIEVLMQSFIADQRLQRILDRAGFPPEQVLRVAEWIRIQEQLREEHDRFVRLAHLKPDNDMDRLLTARKTSLLNHVSEDMTRLARNGYFGPIMGREREMQELFRIFQSGRPAAVIVGESGVGKTALIEGLARQMVEEQVPGILFDHRLVSVSVPQLIASGDASGAMERLLGVIREANISGNIVLVLEGIEALVGGGSGPLDLSEALATQLDRGRLYLVATTTPTAWTTYLERRTLGTKLTKISLEEPSHEQAVHMIMAKTGYIEYEQRVFFSYAALERAVDLAGRYLRETALPQSAIAILQEAAVYARGAHGERSFVAPEDVAEIIHQKTHVPVRAVSQTETQTLLQLEDHLHERVIGQVTAVNAVAQAMRRARAELRDGKRPIANFLFLGPTGVGKTELAKALAAEYFGSEESMIRLDMSEYQDSSAIARVIGAPGDSRGGLLTEAVRSRPFTIVLLDELEKAHPDILTLFLQVMDDGRITDGIGRTIDCTNIVLIATSNAGSGYIQEALGRQESMDQIRTALLERELRQQFRPEFLNRFDGVIVFTPLSLEEVSQIAELLLKGIGKKLEEKGIKFVAEPGAAMMLAKAGYDPLFGARPLRRIIQEKVDNGLATILLKGELRRGEKVTLLADGMLRVEDEGV